jgi:diguanylate cyclase (GGDEF)-like protein
MDKGQSVDRSERKFIRVDGQVIPIVKSVSKITYNGRPALLESFTDISELKKNETDLLAVSEAQKVLLKSILNGMDALICVCDAESFEVLFLNDCIRRHFGIEDDGVGQLCHKLLQKLDEPCPSCPHAQLNGEPDKPIVWEHRERVNGAVLRKTARLINWVDGRKAHLEYALDISGIRKMQDVLEYQNHLLQALNRVSVVMLQSGNSSFNDDVLQAMGIMCEAVNVDRVYIWKNYVRDGALYCAQVHEWSERAEPQQGKELVAEVSYGDAGRYWEDTLSHGRCVNGPVRGLPDSERALLSAQGVVSILAVPIFLQERFWGFVGFDDCRNERVFVENEEQFLRSASVLLAGAVVRHNMEDSITHLETKVDKIYYDPLTDIYNRRFLDENLDGIMTLLSRSDSMLGVMMIDIDFFKKYNDTYGHGAGDNCLKIVAETLRKCLHRKEDFVVRYGGEEFVVILPNTDSIGADRIAGRMLDAVRNCAIPHAENSAAEHVTISIGVVTGKVGHTHGKGDFLKRADEMLYESKRGGRDRHTFARL